MLLTEAAPPVSGLALAALTGMQMARCAQWQLGVPAYLTFALAQALLLAACLLYVRGANDGRIKGLDRVPAAPPVPAGTPDRPAER